jgi:HD-like signal output (HDOD) protein
MTEELSFIEIIKQQIESGEMVLPVFNTSAMRIQNELVKKEANIKVLEQIISSDQSLSSQVLKMANSAFYKGLTEILTVKAAIVRMGMQEIGRITLLASSQNQFRSKDPALNVIMKQLWQHSVGCALGAHWLARRCKFENIAGHAFFAGLLHDVGKLFVLLVVDKLINEGKSNLFTEALLFEAMESLHTEQGYNLMQGWNMPEEYCKIARDHHREDFESKNTLLLLVRVSNMACRSLGIGTEKDEDLLPSTTVEANILNLTELDIAELEIMLEDTSALSG